MEMLLWGWVYPALLVLIFATSSGLLWWVCRTLLRHRLIWWQQVLCALGYFAAYTGFWYSSEVLPPLFNPTLLRIGFILVCIIVPFTIFVSSPRCRNPIFMALQILLLPSLIIWATSQRFSSHAPNAITDASYKNWLESTGARLPSGAFGFQDIGHNKVVFRLQAKDFQNFIATNKPEIQTKRTKILLSCATFKQPHYCKQTIKPIGVITKPVITAKIPPVPDSSGESELQSEEIVAVFADGSATFELIVWEMSDLRD